jgi:S1-C subfamily serine protease
LKLPRGVPVVRVSPGGPAQRAGLQPFTRNAEGGIAAGDVITAVNDEPVKDFDDTMTILERYQPGDRVTLTVWRAGKSRKVTVTLAESDE